MSFLPVASSSCHWNCRLSTFASPTVSVMHVVHRLQDPSRSLLERHVAARVACIAVSILALTESVVHTGLALTVGTLTLAKSVVVLALELASWGYMVAKYYLYSKVLDVSTPNWVVRVLTEVGVLMTSPSTFFSQWKDRIRIFFTITSWDNYLWGLARRIDNQHRDFLNVTHALKHAQKAVGLGVATIAMPLIGLFAPKQAVAKFHALGIISRRRNVIVKLLSRHYGKLFLLSLLAVGLYYDYRKRGFIDPSSYADDLMKKGRDLTDRVWTYTALKGTAASEWLYQRLFGPSRDELFLSLEERCRRLEERIKVVENRP